MIKREVFNKMIDKAKIKKDGIYTLDGSKYLVYKNRVEAFVGNDWAVYKNIGFGGMAISESFRREREADEFLKKNKQKIIDNS